IKIFNNYNELNKIIKKKIDYVMNSIVGINGLDPTLKIIPLTKKIAIANKESIICGWCLIKKKLDFYKTDFIPVDSEHFSLWYGLSNIDIDSIEKIYLTASGGPFYKKPLKNFNNISVTEALNHPSWKMGKKISIDSATMINKVYEVIEAKNIFDVPYSKIKILIHPKSYIHAILKFNNGLIKLVAHETTMKIPIFNTLFYKSNKIYNSKNLDIDKLNNLNLNNVDTKRYPVIKILKLLENTNSLYETVIVSMNDTLVNLFLKKKIKFIDINKYLFKLLKQKEFLKFKKIQPLNVDQIIKIEKYVHLKVLEKVYKSKNA
ncbi:1-deoxy-D-xylulose-5-phosphate reductoisomerase, partial [Candidatus Pelagibacter sp. HIMB1782]|uniref:1-deoxy-D-xylulose-5-phosphate reductoisomerase n=1 Tax=Candidatus Pelagibacter sp. HIMB1782 TaxID=3413375 RepID=UPI003F83BB9D